MIFEINCGHTISGKDTGAQGCGYKEQDLTRQVGNLVMAKLKAKGHTVINCTVDSANSVSEALNSICSKANAVKADYFVSIHLNASNGQGHGVEIFTYGAKGTKEGVNILKNITALGYTNRGIKNGSNLAVIRNTKASAMLVECCFIDNKEDMQKFNADMMADAIVSGLIGKIAPVIKPVVTAPKPITKINYALETQKFLNRLNITDFQNKKLSEDGLGGKCTRSALDKLITTNKGSYTLGFQKFYNKVTQTKTLAEDGLPGPKTRAALEKLKGMI